jgi:hypothetical protein
MRLAKTIPTTMRLIWINELLVVIGLLAPGLVGIQLWVNFAAVQGLLS